MFRANEPNCLLQNPGNSAPFARGKSTLGSTNRALLCFSGKIRAKFDLRGRFPRQIVLIPTGGAADITPAKRSKQHKGAGFVNFGKPGGKAMFQTGIRRLALLGRPAGACQQSLRLYAASRPACSVVNAELQLPPNLKLQDASILRQPEQPPLQVDPQGTLRCIRGFGLVGDAAAHELRLGSVRAGYAGRPAEPAAARALVRGPLEGASGLVHAQQARLHRAHPQRRRARGHPVPGAALCC